LSGSSSDGLDLVVARTPADFRAEGMVAVGCGNMTFGSVSSFRLLVLSDAAESRWCFGLVFVGLIPQQCGSGSSVADSACTIDR
jgi:hypothetical protein